MSYYLCPRKFSKTTIMIHDFNKPFLEVVSSRIAPLPALISNTKAISVTRCNLTIEDIPSKMFEATSIAESLYKLTERLTTRFSHQQITIPTVQLLVWVFAEDYETSYSFHSKYDTSFYDLKRALLTTFGKVHVDIIITCPFPRVSLVYDQFINLLHTTYLQCRDYQNTYECQNVLF